MHNKPVPDSYVTLTILALVTCCGVASLMLAPLFVGGLVTTLGFSSEQAGYLISVELAGIALVSVPAAFWIGRFNWQHVMYAMLIFLIVANLITSTVTSYPLFLLLRLLCGFATALTGAVCMSVINLTRSPDRSLGFWFGLQLLLAAVGLALLPKFVTAYGVDKVYIMLAAFQCCLLFTIHLVPASGTQQMRSSVSSSSMLGLAVLGFVAIVLFEAAVMGTWTYVERIGNAANLSESTIAITLSSANFVGFLASVSAATLATRFGRLLPISIGMGIGVIGIFILGMDLSAWLFLVSVSMFCFAWYFTLPYLMACMANIDPSGRLLVLTNFIAGVGLTLGPALAARLQTADNYSPVIQMGIIFIVVAFILIIRLAIQPMRVSS